MRISDWSSDVCSSDLALVEYEVGIALKRRCRGDTRIDDGRRSRVRQRHDGLLRQRRNGVESEREIGFAGAELLRRKIACDRRDADMAVDRAIFLAESRHVEHRAGKPQIGKASCRERVWKYV